MKKERDKRRRVPTGAIGIGQTVHIQRSGEASSQMIQAYQGTRYDSSGAALPHHGRSLEQIATYKVDPAYAEQTLRQQAGFSAELVQEARENSTRILRGDTTRVRTTDGLGRVNDPQYDFCEVDANGQVLPDTGTQMKFYGVTADGRYRVVDKLARDLSWDRYDTTVLIPSDQYDGALQYAEQQARTYTQQAEKLRQLGKAVEADKKQALAERYEQVKARLGKSDLTLQEALDARVDPVRFTVHEVIKDSLAAGVQGMKCSMLVAGAVTLTQNIVAVMQEDKDIGDAILDTAEATAQAGIVGLTVGTTGSVLKAFMHTSRNEWIRYLGTTSVPTMFLTGVLDVTGCLMRFAKGELDTHQLFEQLGERGVCYLGSGIGASVGGMVGMIAGPGGSLVGSILGGIASYSICSALYNGALGVLKEADIARERREYLEQLCGEASRKMAVYRQMLVQYGTQTLQQQAAAFDRFFAQVDHSMTTGHMETFYQAFHTLEETFGLHTAFQSFDEMDAFMNDESTKLVF